MAKVKYPVLLVGLAVAALLVVPAAASAQTTAASSASVQAHVDSSANALTQLRAAVSANNSVEASRLLRLHLDELRLALRAVATLDTSTSVDLRTAVALRRLIGVSADGSTRVLASLIVSADGPLQLELATTITALVRLQADAVVSLRVLLRGATADLDEVIVVAVADLSDNAVDDVDAIVGVVRTARLSADVRAALVVTLRATVTVMEDVLDELGDISVVVTGNARAQVLATIEVVETQLVHVRAIVRAAAEGSAGGGGGGGVGGGTLLGGLNLGALVQSLLNTLGLGDLGLGGGLLR